MTRQGPRVRRWIGRALLIGGLLIGAAYAAWDAISVLLYASYAIVGAILVVRRPRNVIGWILGGIGFGFVGTTPPPNLDLGRLQAGTAEWNEFLYAWVAAWAGSLSVCLYIALSQLFPTGRLPEGGASRRVAAVLLISAAAVLALTAFGPAIPFPTGAASVVLPNRFALLGWLPLLDAIDPGLLFVPLLMLLIVGVVGMLVRYRRASGILQLQLRWLVAAVAFVALAFLFGLTSLAVFGDGIGLVAWLPALVAYPAVPGAVAMAVLRYRLYEIDRIISRTISWALVSAMLAAAFAGGVLLLQAALSGVTQGQTLAVAGSTLLAFALFQPLRRRVQAAVDHRFDRARYDAQRTTQDFAERVRNEVDLVALQAGLTAVAMEAVRPVGASVWLRSGLFQGPRRV